MLVNKDDFIPSTLEEVLANSRDRECNYYWSHLHKKAREAKEANDPRTEELFCLLGDICTLHLKLDSPEHPFGPMMTSPSGRTAIAEDLDENQLQFLENIVSAVQDADLRARIADLLWVLKRDYKMAELAVSSYLQSALILEDPEQWVGTNDRIVRALQLATLMGTSARSYAVVIKHIEDLLARCRGEDPLFLSARMMSLLQECRAGDPVKYAPIAERLALRAESECDWDRARAYWEIKSKWHRMANEEEEDRTVRLRAAETYVKQSESHLTGNPPSYMLASTFLQKAIEAFRRVGNSADRIQELHLTLLQYQEKSVSELRNFSSSIDITDTVSQAIEHVKGKPAVDALLSLANIANPLNSARLRSQAEENKKKYLLQSLFPKVYMNALGRVIARQPIDDEEALRADMCGLATQYHSIHVQAVIEPARRQIVSEHNIRVADFVALLSNHRLIPFGREMLVARGLHAGLNGDFLVSTHLLVPQLEETVRYLLIQVGVIASSLDDKGIQEEIDLNRTLCSTRYAGPLAKVLSEDLVFEMRSLLVERFGANLRNDMAHGLLDHDSFYSPSSRYLWWLAFRLYSFPVLAKLKIEETKRTDGPRSANSDAGCV
jgi:hypothetical protein